MAQKKNQPKKITAKQKAVAQKKRVETINRQKKNLYSKIYRREEQLASLKRRRTKDIPSIKRVSKELMKLKTEVDQKRNSLGLPKRFAPTKREAKKIQKDRQKRIEAEQKGEQPVKGFVLDPATFPTWEAPDQIDRDIKNGMEWFIVNGIKYSVDDADIIQSQVSAFSGSGGSEVKVNVEYNFSTKTVRYTIQQ